MLTLTIVDVEAEQQWLADDLGVFSFASWCTANGLPVAALVSGTIEVLDTGRAAVIRYGAYQPDPAGGWARSANRQPIVARFEQRLVQPLPRHVRGRRLVETGDQPAEPDDEQLLL